MATSGAGWVTLMAALTGSGVKIFIDNEGAVAGFFTLDGGATQPRIPAQFSFMIGPIDLPEPAALCMRRDGGTDMSGVYAFKTP
jgi:hypothetical protein